MSALNEDPPEDQGRDQKAHAAPYRFSAHAAFMLVETQTPEFRRFKKRDKLGIDQLRLQAELRKANAPAFGAQVKRFKQYVQKWFQFKTISRSGKC